MSPKVLVFVLPIAFEALGDANRLGPGLAVWLGGHVAASDPASFGGPVSGPDLGSHAWPGDRARYVARRFAGILCLVPVLRASWAPRGGSVPVVTPVTVHSHSGGGVS